MTISLFRKQGEQFLDSSGNPISGGKLYYYRATTDTPQDTYLNQAGTTPNSNPIVLNTSGRLLTPVYIGSTYDYKELLTDANDVTIASWPFDNIPKTQTQPTLTGVERLYLPVTQITSAASPVTLIVADAGYGYEIDATSGGVVMNLPSASATNMSGTGYFFKRIDASSNSVTVVPSGAPSGDLIDGVSAAISIPAGYNGIYLVSDGAQWICYAFHSPQARLIGAKQAVTTSGASVSIDLNLGWHVALTLSSSITSFAVTNAPASGTLCKVVLEIASTGAYTITDWPGTVIWSNGGAPTITSSGKDTVVMTSFDGGVTWRGYLAAQAMA